jgi:hypothetical protein
MHLSPDGDTAESPEKKKKKRGARRKGRRRRDGNQWRAWASSPPKVSCTSGVGSTLSWISHRSHAELVKLWVPPGLMACSVTAQVMHYHNPMLN